MKRWWWLFLFFMPLARALAQDASTQPCILDIEETPTNHILSSKLPSGLYNSYMGGGVIAHCRGEGNTMTSDSAEHYDDTNVLILIGHVHYTEPRIKVNSDHMTYYQNEARLIADGHVVAIQPSGTIMRGPWVEYLRVIPGVRPITHMNATGRPHVHMVDRDSLATTRASDSANGTDTVGMDADRINMDGDSMAYAGGRVVIVRSDIRATGDSGTFDNGTGFARLMRNPVIVGTQTKHPFTLKGDVIDIYSRQHQLERVVAKQHGNAVSQDMHLVSDTIDLRFNNKELNRAFAWGPSRAHATTPIRDMLADSLDVIMPNQLVREVRSIRKAYATSTPDTLKIKSKERDWLKGDTIIAQFDSTKPQVDSTAQAPHDTSSEPQIKQLLAIGNAHAFYQMQPKDPKSPKPALNYIVGRTITLDFKDKQVRTADVVDSAYGLYLEPSEDSAAKDSTKAAKKAKADSIRSARRRAKALKGKAGASDSAATKDTTSTPPQASPPNTPPSPPPAAPSGSPPAMTPTEEERE